MNRQNNLTSGDKSDIIACIIAFILIPVIGPFIYLYIMELFDSHERKLKLLLAIDKESEKSNELSKKLESALTSIKYLKQKIAAYETRVSKD